MDELILGNRYELHEEIGSGGMAHVFKARDRLLGRNVAIKVLKPEFIADAQFIERFRVEAQAAASLSNANIVMIYDVGHDEGIYYIVMEYVDGVTLKEYISNVGQLNWREAVGIAIQITQAIDSAHENEIIHRDIKPHNILITRDKKVKVTDFGIARAVSNSTLTTVGSAIGSVHYFSPEQAKGVHTDEKSDLYSLGITLYEMVTGAVPFEGDTPIAVALKQIQEIPTEPMDINPQIPPGLNAIIMKAIEKDRFDRYQSAHEVLLDLRGVLKDPSGETLLLRGGAAGYDAGNMNGRNVGARDGRDMQDMQDMQDIRDARDIRDMGEDDIVNRQNGRGRPPQRPNQNRGNRDYYGDNRSRRPQSSGQNRRVSSGGSRRGDGKGRNPLFIVIPLIAVIIAIGFMVWLIATLFNIVIPTGDAIVDANDTFPVDSYIGKKFNDVRLELSGYNIKSLETRVYSDDYDEGLIIAQDKPRGAKLATNGTASIGFEVSDGVRKVLLSQYKDWEYREAEAELKRNNLKTDYIDEESETVERMHIIKTEPPMGTEVPVGSTVTLYRSLGKEEATISQETIPSLLGDTYNEAKKKLEDRGFRIGMTFPDVEIRADEIVIRQSKAPGSLEDIGTSVDLWFSSLNDDDEPVYTPAPTQTSTEPIETPEPSPDIQETPTPTLTPSPTPTETEEPTPTPTPPPEEPTQGMEYIMKSVRLKVGEGREYGDSIRVLVEVTPSDTGLKKRAINRKIPVANFPYTFEVAVPVDGSTHVAIYYDDEFMQEKTYTPDT